MDSKKICIKDLPQYLINVIEHNFDSNFNGNYGFNIDDELREMWGYFDWDTNNLGNDYFRNHFYFWDELSHCQNIKEVYKTINKFILIIHKLKHN